MYNERVKCHSTDGVKKFKQLEKSELQSLHEYEQNANVMVYRFLSKLYCTFLKTKQIWLNKLTLMYKIASEITRRQKYRATTIKMIYRFYAVHARYTIVIMNSIEWLSNQNFKHFVH